MKSNKLDILHLILILAAISTGFFFSLPVVIFLVITHRLHVWFFKGCIFSNLQKKLGGFMEHEGFLQHIIHNTVGIRISKKASVILDYSLALSPICIVILKNN